jgi:alpha-galactosidase
MLALTSVVMGAAAKDIPAELPDPDGTPGDAARPVKVYILAGQSNMVGMGEISGAKCRYTGIYLTADPAAPKGPLSIYRAGTYKIAPHGVYLSADPEAGKGATASLYKGAHDPARDYDKAAPTRTETVALGTVKRSLPTTASPHTVVVRGCIQVPDSGRYTINPGYGNSSYNIATLEGQEVYRKEPGGQAAKQETELEAGKRYPIRIIYFKGGSTAFWMSQEDLRGKGDLEVVTKRERKFPWLTDEKGNWTVRNDVYYYDARLKFEGSPLSPTSNGRTIGPELGFGHVMGTYHDQQVLLIKTAQGNRSLGFDFRPPSSGRTDPDSKWEGLEYRLMVEGVRKTLSQIDKIVPDYKGQGYEIAGFAWWQGHKDGGTAKAEYEKHLVNLIHDVRKEFKAPKMPVVVATVGFGGHNMEDKYLEILRAQMAVGDPKQHPERAGTVASVDTRDFWREVDDSPRSQGYHYNRNAETYMLVGDALGRAMVRLLGAKAEALPQPSRPERDAQATIEPAQHNENAKQAALAPIVLDGMVPKFVARNREALLRQASGARPKRLSPFLRDALGFGLTQFYRQIGIHDYDWHPFGPDLTNVQCDYYSFDPPEQLPKDNGRPRFRKVTYPDGMSNWFAPDFDPAKAGWKKGLPPFGQLGGKLEPLRESCAAPFCRCGEPPKSFWEKEVLLIRGTFEIPPLKAGHRYRIVVGGSAHVNAGEGYAIYVNGRKLITYPRGVGRRQGGQPRGAFVHRDFVKEFQDKQVTLAAKSFLRYYHPRQKRIPPQGHFTLWLEEMKIPPLLAEAAKPAEKE